MKTCTSNIGCRDSNYRPLYPTFNRKTRASSIYYVIHSYFSLSLSLTLYVPVSIPYVWFFCILGFFFTFNVHSFFVLSVYHEFPNVVIVYNWTTLPTITSDYICRKTVTMEGSPIFNATYLPTDQHSLILSSVRWLPIRQEFVLPTLECTWTR